ncbi:MAG: hypothetical protein EXX96DRAFT_474925 [Benjaminiella poitrasii]|nr:MAG: hypothetical protein EXX96DRAFT_474925 [Benjaminiella poitrasii]
MNVEERNHKIVNVLETYFSDASLLWDKVVSSKIASDPDGMVHFTELAKLPKFRSIKVSSEEIKMNAEERCLSRLQLSTDGQKIGRIKPFIPDKKEELDEWSIYVEGLTKPYNTEAAIRELFNSLVGHVSFFRIPPNKNARQQQRTATSSTFYGYCFIEFDDKNNVEKAIQLVNRYPTAPANNHDQANAKLIDKLNLRILSKIEWNKMRDEYVALLNKRKKDYKQVWDEYNEEHKEELNKKTKIMIDKQEEEEEQEDNSETGTIVFVDGLHPKCPKTTAIALLETSTVKIEYMSPKKKGLTSAYVRLGSSEDAKKICNYFMQQHHVIQQDEKDKTGQKQETRTSDCIRLRILTGSEERIYWENDKK